MVHFYKKYYFSWPMIFTWYNNETFSISLVEVLFSNCSWFYGVVLLSLFNKVSNTFFEICKLLTIHDLQTLSNCSKHFKKLILRMSYPHPVLFPLTKQIYPEIQLKLTKTLIINQMPYSYEWISQVLHHFKNVNTLEIVSDVKSYARIVKLQRSANHANISKMMVDKKAVDRWKHIANNLKLTNIDIRALQSNFRKKRSDYLVINQIKQAFKVQDSPPISIGDSFTEAFHRFNSMRREAVKHYNQGQKLSSIEDALSLNSIILIAPDNYNKYNTDPKEWQQINAVTRAKYFLYRNSDSFAAEMNRLVTSFSGDIFMGTNQVEALLSGYKRETEEAKYFTSMLSNVSNKINLKTNFKDMSEDTFIMTIFDPIFYAYFDNTMDHIIHHGNGHVFPESKERKTKQAILHNYLDSHIHGRRADRSGQVDLRHKHTLYLVEVKTETECGGRPDLVKLGTLMKDALDSALMCGCPRVEYSSVGLLCEGRMVTVYVMDLVLNGVYRMIEVDYFFLPMSIRDLRSLSTIVEPLVNCRALVERNKNLIMRYHGNPVVDCGFIRPTCKSPTHYTDLYDA
ncbi:hypothetical protein K501DRAFT_269379 [Backusella circina FSU 941]|nr:hypothetical protein K501DRAFT_269379 [Backusella circina FSU 941]